MTLIAASVDLILNLTLLVSLSILSGFVDRRLKQETPAGSLLQGVLFAATTLVGMTRPLVLGPGLIFDGRSVMISLCALYFGPAAAGSPPPHPSSTGFSWAEAGRSWGCW
ncbi:MAG: hypothetical protein MZU95_08895 [Desulfomicrobium escambiense]|nr:hypothetical protein [Desulfomicrobium escambiense]